jgi:branched-chain amino acid aminotransferase
MAKGFAEAIALGTDGMLSEGSGQNLFLVRKGTLYTPPIDGTLLPGITRETVLALAADAGIPIREEPLPREMLYIADEVFLSGTASEITPIRSVDKITVGAGKPGSVTKELQRLFMSTVRGEAADPHGWLTHVRAERAALSAERRG